MPFSTICTSYILSVSPQMEKAIRKWKKYECDDGNISSDDSIVDSPSDNTDDETELCDYDG